MVGFGVHHRMAQETPDTERIAREYAEIWNERKYAKIPDVVSESFVMYDPAVPEDGVAGPQREAHGRDGLEQFIRAIVTGFPDFHVTLLDMLSSEDRVMYEAEASMTHEGKFLEIPPTGEKVELRYMGKINIADGKVQEHRVYIDSQEFFEQLGLTDD